MAFFGSDVVKDIQALFGSTAWEPFRAPRQSFRDSQYRPCGSFHLSDSHSPHTTTEAAALKTEFESRMTTKADSQGTNTTTAITVEGSV